MKRIKILFSVTMLLLASVAFGQAEKKVSSMKAGTKLTDTDIGFLNMVANGNVGKSRGEATSATIGSSTYKAGQSLTADDQKNIDKAFKDFQKKYKQPENVARDWCYVWYYYCDYYGYCYYYKYWYVC